MTKERHPDLTEDKPSKREVLREKAYEETTVRGRSMVRADIFKFVGLLAFVALTVAAVALLWPFLHGIFEPGGVQRVVNDVRAAGPWGALILLALQLLQVVVAFVPGEVVQVAAGMIYGPWLGGLIIVVGCVISSAFVFAVVRKLGAPFVEAMVSERHISKLRSFESSRRFSVIVFILFFIPGLPKDIFTYIVPLSHMPMSTFLLISNVGRIPGVLVSTYAAAGIIKGDYLESALMFAFMGALAFVCLAGYGKIKKHLDEKSARGGN